MPRRSVRAVLALVLIAASGFALGSYGVASGNAQGTTELTAPGTETTTETITEATTTVVTEITTAPATTSAPVTKAPTTTAPATTTSPTTTSGESSSSSTPWGWIALGCGLAALILIGFLLWQRHRAGTAAWQTKAANHKRRTLVAMDDVLARGSVVTGQVEALAVEARSLETSAPDDPSKAVAADVRARLEELTHALDADRTLRLGTPPPSGDQLSYSTALIRQHVEALQASLRQPSATPPS